MRKAPIIHAGEPPCPLNSYDRTKRHKLIDIITIAMCAVICGADSWVAIETYGCAKYERLKSFLELPNGIPSPDGDATSRLRCYLHELK